jgi:hypothetical protein
MSTDDNTPTGIRQDSQVANPRRTRVDAAGHPICTPDGNPANSA